MVFAHSSCRRSSNLVTLTLIAIYLNAMSHYFNFRFQLARQQQQQQQVLPMESALRVSVSHLVFIVGSRFGYRGYVSMISYFPSIC